LPLFGRSVWGSWVTSPILTLILRVFQVFLVVPSQGYSVPAWHLLLRDWTFFPPGVPCRVQDRILRLTQAGVSFRLPFFNSPPHFDTVPLNLTAQRALGLDLSPFFFLAFPPQRSLTPWMAHWTAFLVEGVSLRFPVVDYFVMLDPNYRGG